MKNVITEPDRAARHNFEASWSGNDMPQEPQSHLEQRRARFAPHLAAWKRLLPDLSMYLVQSDLDLRFEIQRRRQAGTTITDEEKELLIRAWAVRDYL